MEVGMGSFDERRAKRPLLCKRISVVVIVSQQRFFFYKDELSHYGFVESFPQRWVFMDDEIEQCSSYIRRPIMCSS
jgi:hypothetical protein